MVEEEKKRDGKKKERSRGRSFRKGDLPKNLSKR